MYIAVHLTTCHSAVRDALTARPDAADWFPAVLTSHVVQANVGEALRCVATRRHDELRGDPPASSTNTPAAALSAPAAPSAQPNHAPHLAAVGTDPQSAAEAGVRHLLTFVDAETLYRAALGVYELEVAYLVVACSSKDPAEYLLQLQVAVVVG